MNEYIREFFCFAWYNFAGIVGSIVRLKDSEKSEHKQSILIVGGIGSNPLAFVFFKLFLEKRNFTVYFFRVNLLTSLGFGMKDTKQLAKEIQRYVEKKELNDIVLVGMSAGAVPSLIFLEQCDGWTRVKRFIALSPAFKGGWLSYLNPFSSLAYEMRPHGVMANIISQIKLKYPERMISLLGKWDEFVPSKSSFIEGVQSVQLSEGGHAYLQTFSQKTFKTIGDLALMP